MAGLVLQDDNRSTPLCLWGGDQIDIDLFICSKGERIGENGLLLAASKQQIASTLNQGLTRFSIS